jgi:phospholipid/cholesterol/gamma-HCH transport system permease protein
MADKPAELVIEVEPRARAGLVARCRGAWTVRNLAALEQSLATRDWPEASQIVLDGSSLTALDTAGALLLQQTRERLTPKTKKVTIEGLRTEHQALLELVTTHARPGAVTAPPHPGLLVELGTRTWHQLRDLQGILAFVGQTAMSFLHALRDPRRLRWRTILYNMQIAGFEALPITGLLSFLMGIVIAYQGADQLQRFGANIFIADLVGLSMLRELAPLLTAIIVAGRSGSAYAAQIGTMKVTEEIDALRTIGIAPQELLVLPKVLALAIALPLLTVYADVAGIIGGMIMARAQLDISFDLFLDRLGDALHLSSFLTGVAKAPIFAAIIAVVGCFQGFQAGGSADSVGRQTTVSVVQSIFLVIVADAAFSIVFNWLDL